MQWARPPALITPALSVFPSAQYLILVGASAPHKTAGTAIERTVAPDYGMLWGTGVRRAIQNAWVLWVIYDIFVLCDTLCDFGLSGQFSAAARATPLRRPHGGGMGFETQRDGGTPRSGGSAKKSCESASKALGVHLEKCGLPQNHAPREARCCTLDSYRTRGGRLRTALTGRCCTGAD